MGALDELREAFKSHNWHMRPVAQHEHSTAVSDIIDAFEKDHPGLVDLTEECADCGKLYRSEWFDYLRYCPACEAKRKQEQ